MKKLCCLLLSVLLLLSILTPAFAENSELREVTVTGIYHQLHARMLLDKVNDFRTGPNAWAWDKTNKTKIYYKNLSKLSYDYELEEIAMQRAAEIAVYYGADHTRPNGTSWQTAHIRYNPTNNIAIGENIFATLNSDPMDSTVEAMNHWLEEDDTYQGQSHRRNLLGVPYAFVSSAIACFEANEVYYWVELFRSVNVNPTKTTVGTDPVTKTVTLNQQFIKSLTMSANTEAINLHLGESKTLLPEGKMITTNHILSFIDSATGSLIQEPTVINIAASLKSSNPDVVSVAGSVITARNAGSAVITATAYSKSVQYYVNVLKSDISSAYITLEKNSGIFIYTGNPITPRITSVVLNGKTLTSADYDIAYAQNTEIGTGVIALTGKGNYEGALTKAFQIIDAADCTHQPVIDMPVTGNCLVKGKSSGTHCDICGKVLQPQTETTYGDHSPVIIPAITPTCLQEGNQEGSFCALCGKILVEPVSLGYGDHTVVIDKAVAATCTQGGITEGRHCGVCGRILETQILTNALGHNYPASNTVTKATLSKNGSIICACTRCGDKKVNQTIYYPKTFTLSKTSFTYNGKVQKPKLTIKDAKGNVIDSAHYSVTIPNGKNVGRYKITVKLKGSKYSGTKTLTYNIVPKNTASFSVSAAKKAIKAKWKTQKVQTKGYQIQYSQYSDFKSPKTFTLKNNKYTSATIANLKGGKKYYVRMRTYHTVKYDGSNINLYSSWTATKAVTTKK